MRKVILLGMVFVWACGGGLQKQSLPAPDNAQFDSLSSIWAFSDTDVWVSGMRTLHFDGSSWTSLPLPNGLGASDFWGVAPNDLWAVGGGKVFRWQGSSWSEVTLTVTNVPDLEAIWVNNADDFAIGGGAVNQEILRFVNGTWTRRFASTKDLWGSGSDDVWAAAESDGLWRWTGAAWTEVVSDAPGGTRPEGVHGSSANDVWTVGDFDAIRHWDGNQWTETEAEQDFAGVWSYAPDDVWLGGDDGVLSHFDGSNWSKESAGVAIQFTKLSGTDKSVWALGYELSVSGNHAVVYKRTR
jgi:hypothetical protein